MAPRTMVVVSPVVALLTLISYARVINVDPSTLDETVRRSEIALVEFHAPWCMKCQDFSPEWARVADRLRGHITVAAINGDKYPEAVARFNVEAYPSVVVFVDGEVKEEYKGGMSEEAVLKYVEKLHGAPLPPPLDIPEETPAFQDLAIEGLSRGEVYASTVPLYHKLYLRNDTVVWLLLPPPIDSPSATRWLDAYGAVAKLFAGRAAFLYTDAKSEGMMRLLGYPSNTVAPVFGITQAARHWARTEALPPTLEGPASLTVIVPPFVEAVLSGSRRPTIVSEDVPPTDIPRNDSVWEATAVTFNRIVLAPVDSNVAASLPTEAERDVARATTSVLVMFFSRSCPVSATALEWFHLVAAQLAEVAPSLRLARFEAVDNDYDYEAFDLGKYPTFFLLRREYDESGDDAAYRPNIRELVDRVHYDEVIEILKVEGVVPVGFEPRDDEAETQ